MLTPGNIGNLRPATGGDQDALGVQVTAICGSTKSARACAERWGIPEVYGDYDYAAMYRSPNVDVVHITSPNRQHFEQSMAALRAGKHVVCEKPLAVTAAELLPDGRTVRLTTPDLAPTWGMEIVIRGQGAEGVKFERVIHNSVFRLP